MQQGERVYHLSIHSFTPVLGGEVRDADIGLLFDPDRPLEVALCAHWQALLQTSLPHFRIRNNYPYLGIDDGFTSHLRLLHPQQYAGIELELNQQWAQNEDVRKKIVQSVRQLQQKLKT
ncbi:putative N-formylglutamate amidohydrolase [Cesiribacter andamanensis]|uniref:Putative N-formylglutamate amidohydrolase n=1 Tax=Cesiribacter andamanensis AMV16 TaxID=1279009 RepID=M7NB82_9BACT|nr:putative N-formylglutamate amidohydrolase [Cesiribacter andamanensis]EMR04461.1 putative N-formylglutamate amidohydrolase [Cesiribacter andamanensis AMV16]